MVVLAISILLNIFILGVWVVLVGQKNRVNWIEAKKFREASPPAPIRKIIYERAKGTIHVPPGKSYAEYTKVAIGICAVCGKVHSMADRKECCTTLDRFGYAKWKYGSWVREETVKVYPAWMKKT